jgi:opacity protein-like surface antigen
MISRSYLVILLCFFCLSSLFAQEKDKDEYVPVLLKDNMLITGFFGIPNWGTFFVDNHFRDSRVSNGNSFGIPPLSLEFEYFFSERISGTLTGIYNKWGGQWQELVLDDVNGLILETQRDFSFEVTRIRILAGINYHYYDFAIDNVDLYAGLAIGANSIYASHESNYQGWHPRNDNYFNELDSDLEFPISYRLRGGIRYFLSDKLAVNVEVGIGGPTFNMGINYKLK